MYLDVMVGIIMWKHSTKSRKLDTSALKKFCFPNHSPLKAIVVKGATMSL